jgi:hypothetical protein
MINGLIITNYDFDELIYKLFMYYHETIMHFQKSPILCKSLVLK